MDANVSRITYGFWRASRAWLIHDKLVLRSSCCTKAVLCPCRRSLPMRKESYGLCNILIPSQCCATLGVHGYLCYLNIPPRLPNTHSDFFSYTSASHKRYFPRVRRGKGHEIQVQSMRCSMQRSLALSSSLDRMTPQPRL